MKTIFFAGLLILGGALAQTAPPVPQSLPCGTLIDPPLAITTGADGQPHLGIRQYNIRLTGAKIARNEVPASSARGWTLLHPPLAGATCWRNGIHQSPGVDYTLAMTLITAPAWTAGDTLACDYEW